MIGVADVDDGDFGGGAGGEEEARERGGGEAGKGRDCYGDEGGGHCEAGVIGSVRDDGDGSEALDCKRIQEICEHQLCRSE